ncbi:MAG: LysR family transcriptional regulator [Undibacterium sp.]|nr:LysR family transcriptional regulator [Undibacterium sp.]
MNITFRQLNLLLALAKYKSITAAASACHVTQPTVSMQLKSLSDQVGLPLYEVIGKQVFLTAAGELVVASANTMQEELNYLKQSISAMKGHTEGTLRVALASTAQYFVPRMLGNFYRQHPEIEISFEVLNRDGVVSRLRGNADDLYIMSMPPQDMDLERHAFLENPLVVVAPLTHRLAKKTCVTRGDLIKEQFVLREAGSGTRLACNAYFTEHQFTPKVRLELGSNEAIKQAVAVDLGLAIISQHSLAKKPASEGLAILHAEDFPIHSNWWIIYPKGKRLSPIAEVFLKHLRATCITL